MKVIVFVRQVIDVRVPFEINETHQGLVADGLYYILNPADRCAAEAAVRLKEQHEGREVTVVAIGPARVEDALRECIAIGADRAVHLLDRAFDKSDDFAAAVALSQFIKTTEFDMVLCGSNTIDESSWQVGVIIAELLGLPHVTGVTHLEVPTGDKKAILHRKLERGNREVVECQLPAVFNVEVGLNEPRYPSLPSYIEGLQKEILVHDAKSLGLGYTDVGQRGSLTKIVGLKPPQPRPKKTLDIGSLSPADRIKFYQSGGMTEKKDGNVHEGEPVYLAEKTVRFLVENGFI